MSAPFAGGTRFDAWVRSCGQGLHDVLAEVLADRNEMLGNLTSTQARCTELLEEVRALRVERDGLVKEIVRLVVDQEALRNAARGIAHHDFASNETLNLGPLADALDALDPPPSSGTP